MSGTYVSKTWLTDQRRFSRSEGRGRGTAALPCGGAGGPSAPTAGRTPCRSTGTSGWVAAAVLSIPGSPLLGFLGNRVDFYVYVIFVIFTYHSRFIPKGVAKASQIFLRDTHVLPKLFLIPTLIPLRGVGTTCFTSCCDKDSAIIFMTGRLPDVYPP
jgi:hypothetical protein